MSQYNSLKALIDANIKRNGRQAITGQILNSVLNLMVNTLGAGYQFAGVATTTTNPGTPDARVFYIANGKGTYTNFGGVEVTEDDVVLLCWDAAWSKVASGIATQEIVSGILGVLVQKANDNAVVHIDGVETINGKKTFANGIAMNSKNITNLSDPTQQMDATNKRYVDGVVSPKADKSYVDELLATKYEKQDGVAINEGEVVVGDEDWGEYSKITKELIEAYYLGSLTRVSPTGIHGWHEDEDGISHEFDLNGLNGLQFPYTDEDGVNYLVKVSKDGISVEVDDMSVFSTSVSNMQTYIEILNVESVDAGNVATSDLYLREGLDSIQGNQGNALIGKKTMEITYEDGTSETFEMLVEA